ncbi:TetR/AcrR family transcriptional regulator [Microbispora triticiradicis]|uniref:TetR/AcrR family transcriptional regulator n=1 Tax=Microbispora triticiradicis TaxID=2200763 RepID=UPI001AD69109|nr:TetR/AcrR family transcriptional regulator [Microbispora triticiradicis]MBO4270041.1 TetR family transcriptional regulator [Microbispora triticiradicis]
MEEGLRERKKRETRQRISDIATGLFLVRGFDNVTVAEVARAADVSVNTVFNYFRTKEDLFLDRGEESMDVLARVVRERRPGETAVEAVRRDFLAALDSGDWRYGINEGADVFVQRIRESPALQARIEMMSRHREERLAAVLADETEADPDDMTPSLVAAQIRAAVEALTRHYAMRRLAGEEGSGIVADLRAHAERAFDLLERGVGDYCARPGPRAVSLPPAGERTTPAPR